MQMLEQRRKDVDNKDSFGARLVFSGCQRGLSSRERGREVAMNRSAGAKRKT